MKMICQKCIISKQFTISANNKNPIEIKTWLTGTTDENGFCTPEKITYTQTSGKQPKTEQTVNCVRKGHAHANAHQRKMLIKEFDESNIFEMRPIMNVQVFARREKK